MRRTTPPTIRTADHELRLLLSVSRVITVTEATLFFSFWLSSAFWLERWWGWWFGLFLSREELWELRGEGIALGTLKVLLEIRVVNLGTERTSMNVFLPKMIS